LETRLSNLSLELWQKSTLAALIGLMVGLEREHSQQEKETAHFAGIRTFPLSALLGCTAALLSVEGQAWLFAVGFAGLAALVVTVYAFSVQRGNLGVTTEAASSTKGVRRSRRRKGS
jgi:ABC-type proline/glycine betaine transport system permease subunit